jgi:hypothetical protein
MLTYYKGGFNDYMIRTAQIPCGSNYLALRLQDMLTQTDYGVLLNPGQWTYNQPESFVSFSVNLDTTTGNTPNASQFRATLVPAYVPSGSESVSYNDEVWNGSIQFFQSQSVDKTGYVNQIPLEGRLSADSSNEYIILK